MHAQCLPVCANLFHHAVEMFLKGGLARKHKLSDLKDMGHDLKKLWNAYKAEFTNSTLKRHDKTISGRNKFEDIRYNGVIAAWSGPPGEVTAYGGIKTPKQYKLVVARSLRRAAYIRCAFLGGFIIKYREDLGPGCRKQRDGSRQG
jgi:hypothetical protein